MKKPIKVKFDHFFVRNKTIIYTVLILLFVLLTLYIFYPLRNSNINISDSMIGIFGAILGAIVGGILTLIGSVYVHNNQMKSKSAIQRKNVIYKPLYDELIEIRNILERNPFPTYITFSKGPQTIKPHPQFSAWGRIKNDSRLIQTPKYLADGMDSLYEAVFKYLEMFPVASSEIQDKINEILLRKHKTQFTLQNLGDVIIANLILKSKQRGSLLKEYVDLGLKSGKSLTNDEILEIEDLVYEECHQLDSVKQLIVSYNKWNKTQEEMINTLKDLIELISLKHEKHSGKY